MIPKEEFLKAIEALKQQDSIDDNFQTHMEAAFPGSYAPIYENCLWALSIHLLELAMENRYEYVSWWVYETEYGKREDMTEISWTEDGQEKSVKLTTAEALYDFLVENAKHNDSSEPNTPDSNTRTISMKEFMQIAEKQILDTKRKRPMSGGHFNYNQSLITEIADTIAIEIARALLPKPQKVHEDYWIIDEHNCPCSCHNYCSYHEFKTYEEAERFLLSDKSIVPADHNYGISLIPKEDKVFRSTKLLMGGTKDADPIPWLYTIHHCVFDHYPYDADVLELNEETIEAMKQAYLQIRKAYVYAQRVDWMLSGDDGEDTMQTRLKEELDKVQQEFDNKGWTCPYEGWNEDE